jgi:gliding motility-associated-like protein
MRKILRGHVFNKIFLFTLSVAVLFTYEAQAQVSGTFTINSALPTGGGNFHSFNDAVAFLQSGLSGPVVFNVAAGSGPYNEQVRLSGNIGTTAVRTLTFNCNGVTLTFLSTNPNDRAGVKLNNIDYVTFNNLIIETQAVNDNEYGYGFHLLNDADNNVIKNCTITNNKVIDPGNEYSAANTEGIVINGAHGNSTDRGYSNCDNNLIQQNTISGGAAGITLCSGTPAGAARLFMQGNKIFKNVISNTFYAGIQIFNNDGTLIDSNDISGGENGFKDVAGVSLDSVDINVKITNNRIHNFHLDPSWYGYTAGVRYIAQGAAGQENLIANNLIFDFSTSGYQRGIAALSVDPWVASNSEIPSYVNIYHNTISLDDQANMFGNESEGLYFGQVTDVNILNNIITITRYVSDFSFGIYFEKVPKRVVSNRNVYYVPNLGAYETGVGFWLHEDIITLPEWKKTTGLDYHSTFTDPQYTDLSAFNFKPQPTARDIDNMGLPVNVITDFPGFVRSSMNPDPGAYEFQSDKCQTPISSAGVPDILPDTVICEGLQLALGLTGNSWGDGQTYTFQTSTTETGTYSNISSALAYPAMDITPSRTFYYRVAVTCMGDTRFSDTARVIVNPRLVGGTYTINSAQPTGGINFKSFSDAVLAMQCGITSSVVFNVAPGSGPYNEQVTIPALNTTAARTITFNGNGVTLAFEATSSDTNAVIKLNGADYVTIDSLNMVAKGGSDGFGVHITNDADHNTVKRCTIKYTNPSTTNGFAGIVISPDKRAYGYDVESYCDSNVVTKNTISGGFYGITCTSLSTTTASTAWSVGNVISKNKIVDPATYGIYLTGTGNTVVDSNDISQPTLNTNTFSNFSGIYVYRSNDGLKITGNRIHNLSDGSKVATVQNTGVSFDYCIGTAAAPNMVYNNLVYDIKGAGWQYGLYTNASNYVNFYHNTISLEDSFSVTNQFTRAAGIFGTTATGIELKNNSFIIKRGGTGQAHCIWLDTDHPSVANNNYYVKASGGTSYIARRVSQNYATLSDWQKAGKDLAPISIDPVYKDPINGDFAPTKMLFDDKGVPTGITNDILNLTRSTATPDIGAYEITICKPITQPVLSIDSLGINAVRFAWTGAVNATGYLVSRDGITWSTPSSGIMGLTHTITGLKSRDTVGLMVKTLGTLEECPVLYSQRVVAQTVNDQIFIPNTFTPNGNGKNDVFKVYATIAKSLHLMVFNQWGEKVFDTTDPNGEWNGTYKGKPAPIGVYVYVASMVLMDGTKITQKGSFNLIR